MVYDYISRKKLKIVDIGTNFLTIWRNCDSQTELLKMS